MSRTLRDTYRVRVSTDRSVRAVTPVVNGNQEALQELQLYVLELAAEIDSLRDEIGELWSEVRK